MPTKIKIALFLLFIGIFLPVFSAQAGLVPCGLNVDDPSLKGRQDVPCTLCHLIVGVLGIFNWLRNILVTVAFVGIFIAGVMYVISSGNEEMMRRAKSFLSTSLVGFTLVLSAWLIVNIIMNVLSAKGNLGIDQENWYTFNCDTQASPGTTPGTTTPATPQGTTQGTTDPSSATEATGIIAVNYKKACPDGDAVVPNASIVTNFSGAPNDPSISVDPKCAQLIPNAVNGVSAKILQTIAQIESTCGTNKGESEAKACGLMQLKPKTASSLAGRNVTCDELISNNTLSIELAAKYISQSGYLNDPVKVFAGYNSGYGQALTEEGKKPALYPSFDCPGKSAFECCEDPGKLKETISYVWNATALMSK